MQADIDPYDVLAAMAGYAARLQEHVSQEDVGKVNVSFVEAVVGKLSIQTNLLKAFIEEANQKKDAA